MNEIRKANLIQNGKVLAVEIPAEFGLKGRDLTIRKDGDQVIIEVASAKPTTFREMLDQMETIDVEWPDVDEGLLPPDDIKL